MGRVPRDDDVDDDRRDDDDLPRKNDQGKVPLGSLAQSAREKNLNAARWILIIIGVILVAFHGYEMATARKQVEEELRKQGMVIVNEAEFEKSMIIVRLIVGAAISLGVIFIIMGILVKAFPVPLTITGLVLFLAYQGVLAIADPKNLGRGIFIKVALVVGLVKAVQAALAYQKDLNEQRSSGAEYE